MTEAEWLAGDDPAALLRETCDYGATVGVTVGRAGRVYPARPSDRKLRLIACAVFRLTGGGSWSSDAIGALATAEQHADGLIDSAELRKAWEYIRSRILPALSVSHMGHQTSEGQQGD